MNIYPWQHNIWQRLVQAPGRLPHALLLHGKAGIGKLDFALALSQKLLCVSPQMTGACNACPKCTWFNEQVHPDFYRLKPEEVEPLETSSKKKSVKKIHISVEQIRLLTQSLSLTNHGVNSFRVVLIEPAEALNQASANALLKILEEPPQLTLFVLVARNLQQLLPTIISRCQKIAMPVPSHAQAIAWVSQQSIHHPEQALAYASGSPLLAYNYSQEQAVKSEVIAMLAKGRAMDTQQCLSLMQPKGMEQAVMMLQKWAYDLLLACHSLPQHYHLREANALQTLAKSVHFSALLGYQKQLTLARQTALHPLNLELQLEQLLTLYKKIFT